MRITKIAALVVAGMLMSSCSIIMAATKPGHKDLTVLSEGTPRPRVEAELGKPTWSGNDEQGFDVEVFQFVQGYSGGTRAARAAGHFFADAFTIGLWEFIGTKVESSYSGTEMTVVVTYDEQQTVKSVR